MRLPFDAADAARRVAAPCAEYHCDRVQGDKFGGVLFASLIKPAGLRYVQEARTATELYRGFATAVTGRMVSYPAPAPRPRGA